ncbi:methyltransferase domain-containing protein [Chitinophaga sedimenti]|uniref:methyltransferase domain-containing protein n=1 Tax=Chitinophaga sedimenti TaxID=2033606 RepID=UPI003555CF82
MDLTGNCQIRSAFSITICRFENPDIGSGVGKFCLAGAYHQPQAAFYGIEQRQDLVGHARDAANALQLSNATFIHGNFQSVDFHQYDHFYFYNSFYEHLVEDGKIDQHIHYCGSLYYQYHRNLYQKLADMPIGTRLATLHTDDEHIPSCYCVVDTNLGGLLKYLVKI